MKKALKAGAVVHPAALAETEKRVFMNELYRLHCTIFAGVSYQAFIHHVIEPPARRTKIQLFNNEHGERVGYTAIHFYDKDIDGKACTVLRAEAGLMQEYRGGHVTLMFAFKEALTYRILHPLKRFYYLGTFVHPGVFHMCTTFFHEIYPNYKYDTPPDTYDLMIKLVNAFDVPLVNPQQPLVREVGWITREAVVTHEKWQRDPDPSVQLYMILNPDYANGTGLTTFIPLSFKNILYSLVGYLRRRSTHHRPV